jgi:hypothetical protein
VGRRSAAIRAPHCMRCAGVMAARAHKHMCARGRTRTHIRARDPRAHTRARTCTNASTRAHSHTHPSTQPLIQPPARPTTHDTRVRMHAPHRTAPPRTAPHRTARTAKHCVVEHEVEGRGCNQRVIEKVEDAQRDCASCEQVLSDDNLCCTLGCSIATLQHCAATWCTVVQRRAQPYVITGSCPYAIPNDPTPSPTPSTTVLGDAREL